MRRVRNLGLMAVAALALTAVIGTASASASAEIQSEKYPVELRGESPKTEIKTSTGAFTCAVDVFTGQLAGAGVFTPSAEAREKCSAAAIKMNSCRLEFKPGVETAPGVSEGTVGIGPAGCGPVTITSGACSVSIQAQPSTGAVTYTTKGTGSNRYIQIQAQVNNLQYTKTSCGSGTYSDGVFVSTWDVKAQNAAGVQVGLYIAAGPPHAPQLESARYPTSITGLQGAGEGQHRFKMDSGTMACETATLSGSASAAVTSLTTSASYAGCYNPLVGTETVKMNSCQFELSVLNVGPPYGGNVDLACSKAGDAIEIVSGICTVKVGAQSGFASVGYANSNGSVIAAIDGTGIDYSQHGLFCPGGGSGKLLTNGKYWGTTTLSGSGGALVLTGEKM